MLKRDEERNHGEIRGAVMCFPMRASLEDAILLS